MFIQKNSPINARKKFLLTFALVLLITIALANLPTRAKEGDSFAIAGCSIHQVGTTRDTILRSFEIHDSCKSGACKVFVSWQGPYIGMFEPGISWPITLHQESNGEWRAGPVIKMGGYFPTEGIGVNGDNKEAKVIAGGKTPSGNSFSIHDDYQGVETNPNQWTIEVVNSNQGDQFKRVNIYSCRASRSKTDSRGCEICNLDENDESSKVDIPNLCQSGVCRSWVSWRGGNIGLFKEGLSFPTTFSQKNNGNWASGPHMVLGGFFVTEGSGLNGNDTEEALIGGGESPSGNSFSLLDDKRGIETDSRHWTFELENLSSSSRIQNPQILTCKLADLPEGPENNIITKIPNKSGIYKLNAKPCRSTLCEVWVTWKGATIGLLDLGFFWPVTIHQKPEGDWIAGPSMKLGGVFTTKGEGTNGDRNKEEIVGGGKTASGNHLRIFDDYPGVETNPNEWSFKLENTAEKESFNDIRVYILPRNLKPLAQFKYFPKKPNVNQKVQFDASGSVDKNGKIDNYRWFFGDGSATTGNVSTHKFKEPGTYKVRLTIIDSEGSKDLVTKELTVRRSKARIKVTVLDNSGDKLDAKIFIEGDFEGTTGTDGVYSSTGLSPDTYVIRAEKEGYKASERSIYLSPDEKEEVTLKPKKKNKPPQPFITYKPKEPKAGQKIIFDATRSTDPDGTVKEYSWDLTNDGKADKRGAKVNYTYDSKGKYKAKLTVTDNNGTTASITEQIEVTKPQEEVKIEDKYALVVGIADYKYDTVDDLNYSEQDAKDFYQFLINDNYESIPEDNVTLLTNQEATTQAISQEMTKLVTRVDENDLVIIYYSGHGAVGPDYNGDEEDGYDEYYVTYNTNTSSRAKLYSTGINDDQFGNWLTSMDSKQIAIFLDSCYSGGATKATKGTTIPGQKAIPKNEVFNDFSFEDRLLFAASRENQPSWESEKLDQGVFTHFLLKGLKGKADTNDDGQILADELYSYLKPHVTNYVDEHFTTAQTPLMKGSIRAPLARKEVKLEGKVKYVKGEKKNKANKGEYVVINLGEKDGVKKGDFFKVLYATKGVGVIEELQSEIKITDVVGLHLAVGKVTESGITVEKGYKVKKIKKD